jgi:C-terminal processing protease CtpA/Prc
MRHIIVLSLVASTAVAAPEVADADRRLAAAGIAWGRVAFLHPALHEPRVDWDQAYIDAVPAIAAARDAAEYRAAVERMAAAMGDPSLRVVESTPGGNAEDAGPMPAGAMLVEQRGRLTLSCADGAALLARDAKAFEAEVAALAERVARARALVVECRGLGRGLPLQDWSAHQVRRMGVQRVLDEAVAVLAQRPLTAGVRRYREHSGFAAESGSSSGGYGSTLEYERPRVIPGRATRPPPPVAFVVDDRADAAIEVAAALQHAGIAQVVHELPAAGQPSALWVDTAQIDLGDGLAIVSPVRELVATSGADRFAPFAAVPADQTAEAVERALRARSTRTATPAAQAAPLVAAAWRSAPQVALGQRVFAVVRAWTIIDLFFPYKHLMDRPLDGLLVESVARARTADTLLAYHDAIEEFGAALDDSHIYIGYRDGTPLSERIGLFAPPLALRFVGERALLMPLKDPAPMSAVGLAPGDEVLEIDGRPVAERLAAVAVGGSTPQAVRMYSQRFMLRGPEGSAARLKVRAVDGRVREVEVPRSLPHGKVRDLARDTEHEGPVWRMLPSGYGYMDLVRLEVAEVDKALDELMAAPGLILDMRGYPRGTAWQLAPRLGDHAPGAIAAQFRRPLVGPDLAWSGGRSRPDFAFAQPIPVRDLPRYKGKVVVLIDARAVSQSEHSCLFYRVAAGARFVGSPTTGANGDVTGFALPGGLYFGFTGHDVRHADGRQLQRVGIVPDLQVLPTPAGIAAGRDEVLEAAVGYLGQQLKPSKGKR